MFNKTNRANWSIRPPLPVTASSSTNKTSQDRNLQGKYVIDMVRGVKMMHNSKYLNNWYIWDMVAKIRGSDEESIWVWFPWETAPVKTMSAQDMIMELSLEVASGCRIVEAQANLGKIFHALQCNAMSIGCASDAGEMVGKTTQTIADAFKVIVDVSVSEY